MQTLAAAGMHTFADAASGVLNGVVTGGDVGRGAAIGAISAGASYGLGNGIPLLQGSEGEGLGNYLGNVTRRSAIGAIAGGSASAAMGGDFGRGAGQGATTSAIAYTCNETLHKGAEKVAKALSTNGEANPKQESSLVNQDGAASGCSGEGCIAPFGGAKFKWYDITSWYFHGQIIVARQSRDPVV